MSYKKRAKKGWETGKRNKKKSNERERLYAKKETEQDLNEIDENYKYKHTKPRKINLEKKVESKIIWIERKIEEYKDYVDNKEKESFLSKWAKSLKHRLTIKKRELKKIRGKND